jgi:hypothetical protein
MTVEWILSRIRSWKEEIKVILMGYEARLWVSQAVLVWFWRFHWPIKKKLRHLVKKNKKIQEYFQNYQHLNTLYMSKFWVSKKREWIYSEWYCSTDRSNECKSCQFDIKFLNTCQWLNVGSFICQVSVVILLESYKYIQSPLSWKQISLYYR